MATAATAKLDGPFLGAFVMCRRAWRGEQWGSIDGIIDKLVVDRPELARDVENCVLAILIYGRSSASGWRFDIRVTWPDETIDTIPAAQVVADDEAVGGAMIPIGIEIPRKTAGVIWFELLVDERPMARIPFKVVHEWMASPRRM
jgi:hypothetical protein